MTYQLYIPDLLRGREPALILWDDVAGTVEGTHTAVAALRHDLSLSTPLEKGTPVGPLVLRDPAHDPADFVALLRWHQPRHWSLDELPEPLRSVVPTPIDAVPIPDDAVA